MSGHTSTPWGGPARAVGPIEWTGHVCVGNELIATTYGTKAVGPAIESAHAIVRAVNSHDALVAALEAMMARVDGEVAYGDTWEEMAAASAALAQATTNPRASAEE